MVDERLVASRAVIKKVLAPVATDGATVKPVTSHVLPVVLVRTAEAEPPIDERSAVTEEILLF